jgi:hypothetical protein
MIDEIPWKKLRWMVLKDRFFKVKAIFGILNGKVIRY